MSKPIAAAAACALAMTLGGVARAEPVSTAAQAGTSAKAAKSTGASKSVASLGPNGQDTADGPGALATAPLEPDTTDDGRDVVRLRGGFSLNGGTAFGMATGPVLSAAARVGVQVSRSFAVYYQQSPTLFLASNQGATATGFLDLNSVLASVTLADVIDVGAGPSVDYRAAGTCSIANECTAAGTGWQLGSHGRVAITLGARDPETGRRSGVSIGLDEHPMFGGGSVLALTTLGIGGEWY
jgi:hypothetical protein